MKSLLILGCLFFAAVIILALAASHKLPDLTRLRSLRRACGLHAGILRVNALTDGENRTLSKRADAAHTTRHLLVKAGTDAEHVALGTANAIPIGVCFDEPEAAEDVVTVRMLGLSETTLLMVAGEAMATTNVYVYAGADGKIMLQGIVRVGTLRSTASGDGIPVEVEPCAPIVAPNGKTTKASGTLAVPITHRFVTMTTGGAEALTLADGLPGQRLGLTLGTDGGDGTLTPTTKTGFTAIVFADAKDTVDLEFVDSTVGWIILGTNGPLSSPPAYT